MASAHSSSGINQGPRVTRPQTRSEVAKEFDADNDFPPSKVFQPPTKLPTIQSVIGMLRYHLEGSPGMVTTNMAVREVAKQIYAKYYHDTVYCVSLSTIIRRVETARKQFSEGRKRYDSKGKDNSKAVKAYKDLFARKLELFDVYAEDPLRRQTVAEEWGVSMSDMEHQYYEDQRTERKMLCSKGVDPVWYHSTMRAQRLRERQDEYKMLREQQFQYKSLERITELLVEAGEIPSTASSSDEDLQSKSPKRQRTSSADKLEKPQQLSTDLKAQSRKKLFKDIAEADTNDPLPNEFQHIRVSERKVRDEFYSTVANLSGKGLSICEASSAIIEVGNTMFGRRWIALAESEELFDINTAPTNRNIRAALQQIEAQSLCLVVNNLRRKNRWGR